MIISDRRNIKEGTPDHWRRYGVDLTFMRFIRFVFICLFLCFIMIDSVNFKEVSNYGIEYIFASMMFIVFAQRLLRFTSYPTEGFESKHCMIVSFAVILPLMMIMLSLSIIIALVTGQLLEDMDYKEINYLFVTIFLIAIIFYWGFYRSCKVDPFFYIIYGGKLYPPKSDFRYRFFSTEVPQHLEVFHDFEQVVKVGDSTTASGAYLVELKTSFKRQVCENTFSYTKEALLARLDEKIASTVIDAFKEFCESEEIKAFLNREEIRVQGVIYRMHLKNIVSVSYDNDSDYGELRNVNLSEDINLKFKYTNQD